MGRKNKHYTQEFKRDALVMSSRSDISDAQLERDLGITSGLPSKWRKRYRIEENSGELKHSQECEAEAEIRRLKRELAIAQKNVTS